MVAAKEKRAAAPAGSEPVVIKKYANRRLYNTDTSTYVTLDDLCELVKKGTDFTVFDAKTGEDLTRSVLTQIIFEQESKGYSMLPISFLRSLIGFYDNKVQTILPHYLEAMMNNFSANQDRVRQFMDNGSTSFSPFTQFEEIGKQNMAMFNKAFEMFNPFGGYFSKAEEDAKLREKRSGTGGKKG